MAHSDDKDIYIVNLEDFEARVLDASHKRPILVDLWADWCPPCLVIGPILEKVVREYGGKVALAKVEVDEGHNMKIAGRYQARGFPTILLIQNGEEKARFAGAKPQSFIEDFIEQNSER